MIKFEDILNEKAKKQTLSHNDRLKMYEKYYKNLSPKGFKVKLQGDKIEITLDKGKKLKK